jgi:DNA repair photolyase
VNEKKHITKGRGAQVNPGNSFEKHSYTADNEFLEHLHQSGEEVENATTEYIKTFPKSLLNKVPSPDIPSDYSMNPYQGCEHGCTYCYARTTHEFWGYSAGQDFEQKILVKENAPELLEKKLQSNSWKGDPIMLSGNTDCYQPIERKLEITRKLLEICLNHRQPVGIITKNALITRDLDILEELSNMNLVKAAISITSLDNQLRSLLEPRTSSADQKFKAVRALTDIGVPVSVMMAPIIPALNSHEVFDIAKKSEESGAINMAYTMIRLNGITALLFENWIQTHYPDKASRVLNQIRGVRGGELGDTNYKTRMRGQGIVAQQIKDTVSIAKKKYNLEREFPEYDRSLFRRLKKGQLDLF